MLLESMMHLMYGKNIPMVSGPSVLYLLFVYFLLKQVVSLSARGHTASAVLSLAHVRYPNSRGSADVVYFLLTGGVSLYAKGCTTSVVLSLAYV